MNSPVILILTKKAGLYYTFRDNIREIFGDGIQLRSNLFPPIDLEEADLILSSGSDNLYHDLVNSDKVKAPLLVANRSIDSKKLEKLFELPKSTRCLLVSNDEKIAEQSVTMLKRLGFDYLNFTAYSPHMENVPDIRSIDVAITHGLADLVPKEVNNVLDLGNRGLDLSTLFEISKVLEKTFNQPSHITMDYLKNFVRIGRELAISVQNKHYINSYLEAILNAAQEGIVFMNEQGIITLFNEEASSILGIDNQKVIDKHYTHVLRDFQVEKVMKNYEPIPREIIKVQGLNLMTTIIPLMMDGNFSGVVVTFQDVTHVERMEMEIQKNKKKSGLTTKYTFADSVGVSNLMNKTKEIAKKLARSEYTVLITGESGTGKEIFAQAIHDYSSRSNGPFVAVNFAGISQSIAESELFGYEEGAFTGASRGGKTGLFELAQNGTIFLDEIGDAPLNIQAAILRVLQENNIMRVGGNKIVPINVRVIAATNKNLDSMIKEGTFREDLFYRLNQLPLTIPPLRERTEDIPALIDYFLSEKNSQMRFPEDVMSELTAYNWPGNVRELEGLITYLSVIVDGIEPAADDLPAGMNVNKHKDVLDEKRIARLLENNGEVFIYREILHCLSLSQKHHSGIGRTTLKSMMNISISESQLRTKLDILKDFDLICSGVKKQGTKITQTGLHVLSLL